MPHPGDPMADISLEETKEELKKISHSFCSAKWLQTTIYLQNGFTHSCHHPKAHKIPLNELRKRKESLHNTKTKKRLRKQMLKGQRPSECQYCWSVEDLGEHFISDRHIKSHDSWSRPYLNEIAKAPWDSDIAPTYLEISFSNVCNFKCAYCEPAVSSKWYSEIQEYGPYPTRFQHNSLRFSALERKLPILEEKNNPYVKAFWDWWPELYRSLKVFRVTGGEPLLSPNTFRILDFIDDHPNKEIEIAFNSNLGVPHNIVEKFSQRVSAIRAAKKVKSITVFTSVDTWGEQAEYIRHGLDLSLFQKNLETLFLDNPDLQIVIMCAFNLMSVFRFKGLLDLIVKQRSLGRNLTLDISILHNPDFLDCRILPVHWKQKGHEILGYMEECGFYKHEVIKMQRLVAYMNSSVDAPLLDALRRDFVIFIGEHDKRRHTQFEKIFSEFMDDFQEWSKIPKQAPIKSSIYRLLLGRVFRTD